MTIQRGAFVRPNTASLYLPLSSVWRVICTDGGFKLEAVNAVAGISRCNVVGRRFAPRDFDEVVQLNGQWVDAQTAIDRLRRPVSFCDDAVTAATVAAEQAANTTDAIDSLLEAARKLEAERQEELRAAKAAQAKADKEAAAKAKTEEVKRQLSARLHADRCLGEATLELIAEVSRLNNGGSEQVAHSSIASHAEQLQPLAKSYGYRIAKPSLLAQVVKL